MSFFSCSSVQHWCCLWHSLTRPSRHRAEAEGTYDGLAGTGCQLFMLTFNLNHEVTLTTLFDIDMLLLCPWPWSWSGDLSYIIPWGVMETTWPCHLEVKSGSYLAALRHFKMFHCRATMTICMLCWKAYGSLTIFLHCILWSLVWCSTVCVCNFCNCTSHTNESQWNALVMVCLSLFW